MALRSRTEETGWTWVLLMRTGPDVIWCCRREGERTEGHLSLGVIQLQPTGCHPIAETSPHRRTDIFFNSQSSAEICGSAKPVDLSVVGVGMRNQLVALQYNCSRSAHSTEGTGSARGPIPAVLTPYRTCDGVNRPPMCVRVEHGHTNRKRTSSAPARQDCKSCAPDSILAYVVAAVVSNA